MIHHILLTIQNIVLEIKYKNKRMRYKLGKLQVEQRWRACLGFPRKYNTLASVVAMRCFIRFELLLGLACMFSILVYSMEKTHLLLPSCAIAISLYIQRLQPTQKMDAKITHTHKCKSIQSCTTNYGLVWHSSTMRSRLDMQSEAKIMWFTYL